MSYYRYDLGTVEGSRRLNEVEESAVRIAKTISCAILGNVDRDAASSGYSSSRTHLRSRLASDLKSLARTDANVAVSLEWDAEDTLFFALTHGDRWTVQQTLYLRWRGNELFEWLIKGNAEISNDARRDCLDWLQSMAVELDAESSGHEYDAPRQIREDQ